MDPESRRVRLWVGNDAYTFVYDPTASIPAVVQEFGPDDRNFVYVREPEGSPAARACPDEWMKDVMLSSTQHPVRPAGRDPEMRLEQHAGRGQGRPAEVSPGAGISTRNEAS